MGNKMIIYSLLIKILNISPQKSKIKNNHSIKNKAPVLIQIIYLGETYSLSDVSSTISSLKVNTHLGLPQKND